jgi:RNA polymerase sigma-70 factor (ECF subfamily)
VKDEVLINNTLSGDSASYGTLVEKYQDRLYATMVHVVGNSEDAHDVVQEAFIQAYLRLDTFRRSSRFYTWLYRIAFNVALGMRRKRRPTLSVEYFYRESGSEPVDRNMTPEESSEREEQVSLLRAAIDQLNEEHRMVIVLRELEDCSYEDISEILDVPVGTIRSRLHRARSQLRESLFRNQ